MQGIKNFSKKLKNKSQNEEKEESDSIALDRESVESSENNRIDSYYCSPYQEQVPKSPVKQAVKQYEKEITTEPINEITNARISILKDKVICRLCQDKKSNNDQYIILSCNHVYHIRCLYNEYYNNAPVTDKEYIESRDCLNCNEKVQPEDLMCLHSKFLNLTKDDMTVYEDTITKLEEQLRKVKNELSKSYDVRQRVQLQRDKCKQIVNTLTMLM